MDKLDLDLSALGLTKKKTLGELRQEEKAKAAAPVQRPTQPAAAPPRPAPPVLHGLDELASIGSSSRVGSSAPVFASPSPPPQARSAPRGSAAPDPLDLLGVLATPVKRGGCVLARSLPCLGRTFVLSCVPFRADTASPQRLAGRGLRRGGPRPAAHRAARAAPRVGARPRRRRPLVVLRSRAEAAAAAAAACARRDAAAPRGRARGGRRRA